MLLLPGREEEGWDREWKSLLRRETSSRSEAEGEELCQALERAQPLLCAAGGEKLGEFRLVKGIP